jgi:WD40 repeat protein
VWVDRADIFPSSAWRPEIEQGVLEAHALVFVVSPESVSSEYCGGELAIATEVGKRVVPVLARDTPMETVPESLAALHFLSFVGCLEADGTYGESFEAQVDRLVEVLGTDIDSIHLHTRLLNQSRLWAQRQHDKGLLLRGGELEEAERWLDEQVSQRRMVQPDQQRLVRESRRAATRRQRGSAGMAAVVAVVMLVLGVVALVQRSQAVRDSNLALAGELAAESQSAAGSNVTVQDLLALEAYRWAPTPQSREALVAAAEQPLERSLSVTPSGVNQVAYDPAGRLLAAASAGGVTMWSTVSDSAVGHRLDVGQDVNSVAFSPNGDSLVAAQNNGDLALFALPSETEKGILLTDGSPVAGVAFSPGGTEMAAVTQGGGLYLYNFAVGQQSSFHMGGGAYLTAVAFDPRLAVLAVSGAFNVSGEQEKGFVDLYSETLAPRWTFSQRATEFTDVAFNPEGSTLGAASESGGILLLSVDGGREVGHIALASSATEVAFNSSGHLMATASSKGAIQLWSMPSDNEVGAPMEDGSDVFGLAFSPDGSSLASADLAGDVVVWSPTTLMPEVTDMNGPSALQLSVNSNNRLLATSTRGGTVNIWDVTGRTVIAHLASGVVLSSVAFSPQQATTLAIGESSGAVALYDLPRSAPVVLVGPDSSVNQTAFDARGDKLAASYGDGDVVVWDVRSRKELARFPAPSGNAGSTTALAFSPDGDQVAAAYSDYGIVIFPMTSAHSPSVTLGTTAPISSLAYTPDGSVLIGGDFLGNAEIFDAPRWHLVETLSGDGSSIYGLSVTPDGHTMATADDAGNLQLWDLATFQKVGPAIAVGSPLLGLAFFPDRSWLATWDNAGTITLWPSLLWSTNLKAFAADLCPRVGSNLSLAQWRQYVPGRPYQTICPGYPRG